MGQVPKSRFTDRNPGLVAQVRVCRRSTRANGVPPHMQSLYFRLRLDTIFVAASCSRIAHGARSFRSRDGLIWCRRACGPAGWFRTRSSPAHSLEGPVPRHEHEGVVEFRHEAKYEREALEGNSMVYPVGCHAALCGSGGAFAQNKAIDFKPVCRLATDLWQAIPSTSQARKGPRTENLKEPISRHKLRMHCRNRKDHQASGLPDEDIVSVTVYITDLNEVPKMNEVYKKLMPDPKPARATVQVAGLIGGAKIEISAIAVRQ